MTILFSIISSLLIEAYKKISDKLGMKRAKQVVFISLFVLSFVWVLLQEHVAIFSAEAVKYYMTNLLSTVGVYELVLKKLFAILNTKNTKK